MNADELRAVQAPLKARYKNEPAAAMVTLTAIGTPHEPRPASTRRLRWRLRTRGAASYEDIIRVTEDGAEAIGLALAYSTCAWRIERRLQARLAERTDWLMTDASPGATMVLEIGGTDEQDARSSNSYTTKPRPR